MLDKEKIQKKGIELFVGQSIPKRSFIPNLSQNHKMWQLWYNSDTFYGKYAFNMKTQKCKKRQKHFRCIHRCNNKSSFKVGVHHNTADSLWNCLSQRLAQMGLIPHDVGGSGDCFFKSVSHQLYATADLHVEVRMARISHLHNYPKLYIESISDDTWENYIKQMSIPSTWHQFISYVHFPLLVLSFQSDLLTISFHTGLLVITFCLLGQLLSPFHLTGSTVQFYYWN